jgi:hypothetical protein
VRLERERQPPIKDQIKKNTPKAVMRSWSLLEQNSFFAAGAGNFTLAPALTLAF